MKLTHLPTIEEPIIVSIEGNNVRAWLDADGQPMEFAAVEFGKAISLSQPRMANIIKELPAEDVGIRETNTNAGRRRISVISRSGCYQVIAQLQDRDLGRRLRKRLADLGVAYETGKLQAGQAEINKQILTALTGMQAAIIDLTKIVMALVEKLSGPALPLPRSVKLQGRPNSDLPIWTHGEHRRMRRSGYLTAADVLGFKLGRKPTAAECGSLTARTTAYCRVYDLRLIRYWHQGRVRVYLPQTAAELVYRTGWTAGNAVFAESQGDLFKALGEKEAG